VRCTGCAVRAVGFALEELYDFRMDSEESIVLRVHTRGTIPIGREHIRFYQRLDQTSKKEGGLKLDESNLLPFANGRRFARKGETASTLNTVWSQ